MDATRIENLPPRLAQAFRQAEAATGTPFDYLVETAFRESGFDTDADAATSSARGLFQFIDQTWLATLRENGGAFGLSDLADEIEESADGRFMVPDSAARGEIMGLRDDPDLSALMAGALAQENRQALESRLQRPVSAGELYIAHVMGPNGAGLLIETAEIDPGRRASTEFPRAAAANPGLFYTRSGEARTVSQLVERLSEGFSNALMQQGAALAEAAPARSADLLAAHGLYGAAQSAYGAPMSAGAYGAPMAYDSLYSGANERIATVFSGFTRAAPSVTPAVSAPQDRAQTVAAPVEAVTSPAAPVTNAGEAAGAVNTAVRAADRMISDLLFNSRGIATFFGES